ncbi:hypothetical protein FA95DRAFT_1562799 [Auriscalpium vulgare]|uniref:Uncharacterized protein n=1 Tax=Auriscalpium vulgare TaxID=40419 RepID=A0ACB8RIZ1_9AGAM|nr:hypothetical protein FA95DRAFT_1562799 [Auriscalpium vulgare]
MISLCIFPGKIDGVKGIAPLCGYGRAREAAGHLMSRLACRRRVSMTEGPLKVRWRPRRAHKDAEDGTDAKDG